METIGTDEMRHRVGSKIRVTNRHSYTTYKLNSAHPLWKGEDFVKAMGIIKSATWRGVDQRGRNQQPEAVLQNGKQLWAGTLATLPNVDEEGRACPHRTGTAASLSNGDGTDSGTFSLQNNAPNTRLVCNDQPVPTPHPKNSLAIRLLDYFGRHDLVAAIFAALSRRAVAAANFAEGELRVVVVDADRASFGERALQ